jgi:hypothetical protein
MRRLILVLSLSLLSSVSAAEVVDTRPPLPGGAACVMAKWQGNTLDYALVTGMDRPDQAQEAARAILREKGYGRYVAGVDVTHPQGMSGLPHAYVVVIRSDYKTVRDKDRTSFGCGFSPRSYEDALWDAIRDLQRYSWGWVPDRDGYRVVERRRY